MPRIEINGRVYSEDDFKGGPNSVTTTDEKGNTTTITAGANSIVVSGGIHATSIDMGRS